MFRVELALPDENDDVAASVRVIGRKNAGLEISAVRSQRRVSRDPERRR